MLSPDSPFQTLAAVTAIAKVVPEVDWPVDFDVSEFSKPL